MDLPKEYWGLMGMTEMEVALWGLLRHAEKWHPRVACPTFGTDQLFDEFKGDDYSLRESVVGFCELIARNWLVPSDTGYNGQFTPTPGLLQRLADRKLWPPRKEAA